MRWVSCSISLLVIASTSFAELAKPDATLSGHSSTVLDLAFSPDGKQLASVGDDGKLKIWDVAAGKEVGGCENVRNNANQVRFTPDGQSVLTLGSSNNLIVFDIKSGKTPRIFDLPNVPGGTAAFDLSPDGKIVASVGRSGLSLIDVASTKLTQTFDVHKLYNIPAVAFSSDGKHIATVGTDHVANVIDASNGQVLKTMKIRLNGTGVLFSQDGKTLFASNSDQTLQSFDIASGEAKTLIDKGVPVLTLHGSTDGKMVIVGGPGHSPFIIKLPEGELQELAYDADGWVKSANISPDGKWLAGGSNDGNVYLWKVPAH